MQRKKTNIPELLKSAAVVILLVALICLCASYMLSYQRAGGYAFTKNTMATLSGESVKYQYADHFKPSYASPKFVGFSARELGKNAGFHCLGGENEAVSASLLPFYRELFGENGSAEALSADEGKALFSEALAGDHIYAAYENDLPKSLIYALAAEDATVREISNEYIREILIVPERHLFNGVSTMPAGVQVYTAIHTFYAVARDTNGNYYRYLTDYIPEAPTDVSFNTNYYLTYTTAESYFYYEYACMMETDLYFEPYDFTRKVSDTTAVLTSEHGLLPQKEITLRATYPEADMANALLGALLINPEKVTSFTDSSGVRFYYDEGSNVSVSPNGILEYHAFGEEGLSLSELFEYRTEAELYDARDYVGAALVLVHNLEYAAHPQGCDYDLYLSRVLYDGNLTTVTFGCASDGLPLYFNGNAELLRLVFGDGMLKEVSYTPRDFSSTHFAASSADMLWDLRVAVTNMRERNEYAYAYYLYNGESAGAELVGRKTEEDS